MTMKHFEYSMVINAENRSDADNTAMCVLEDFVNGNEPWVTFGEVKEIPFRKKPAIEHTPAKSKKE